MNELPLCLRFWCGLTTKKPNEVLLFFFNRRKVQLAHLLIALLIFQFHKFICQFISLCFKGIFSQNSYLSLTPGVKY